MCKKGVLLDSIAHTIRDYRTSELPQPTPDHVNRWVGQFETQVQVPILREVDHVLRQTYFSKRRTRRFLASLAEHSGLTSNRPYDFWRAAMVLELQNRGSSQDTMRGLLFEELERKYGIAEASSGAERKVFVYLDDALFGGNQIYADLSEWLRCKAPATGTVYIAVMVAHSYGKWWCRRELETQAANVGKDINFTFYLGLEFENRRMKRNQAEVLWPAVIPDNGVLLSYMNQEQAYPFEPREPGHKFSSGVFSSEKSRQLLETELLLAGVRIRSFCANPNPRMRPLGYSRFGLGFGSTIVTYRNCPNNAPLAFWFGNPDARAGHPFSRWYPLFERKTRSSADEMSLEDFLELIKTWEL